MATPGSRIYQYTNQDGITFWSFEKLPFTVTHSHTLTLDPRIGTHFDNYLAELRILRQYFIEQELLKSEDDGRG
jgi:hypothetical protein